MWKEIQGYEGRYLINEKGEVKSVAREIDNGNGFRKTNDLILKYVDNGFGYWRVCLSIDNKKKYTLIHKLLAIYFITNPFYLPVVNHKDGNKKNNALDNLEWCTSSQNNQHGYDTGLIKAPKGEESVRSKLTEKQVLEIKELLKKGYLKQTEIAKIYNIHKNTINAIKQKTIWKHL